MADNDFLPPRPFAEQRIAFGNYVDTDECRQCRLHLHKEYHEGYIGQHKCADRQVGKGEVYKGEERLQGQSSPNRLPYNATRNTGIGKPRAGIKVVFEFKHIIIVLK